MNSLRTELIENGIDKIVQGIDKVAEVIVSTMGGSGKNVIIRNSKSTVFTKDGVSVASSLNLKDPIENIGANLIIEAANKTVHQCGDGTTTTTLFAHSLLKELLKLNVSIETILDELDEFLVEYESLLRNQSKKIENIQDIYNIALTSGKSAAIARLLKEIYQKTGNDANVSLEMSKESDSTYYELVNGLNFESGMINSRFANEDNGNCVYENAYIMLENDVVSKPIEYKELFDKFLNDDEPLVIIAPGFSDLFIRFALTAKSNNGLKICLITSPGYGSSIKENYRDIATFSNNGYIDKIVITNYDFTIFNQPDLNKINKRTEQLRKMIDNAHEELFVKDYEKRIIALNQLGAVIYVGGQTATTAKEEYDRIEDALGAVKMSIKGGYVKGAGSELYQISNALSTHYNCYDAFINTLKLPFVIIMRNANISRELKHDIPYNVKLKQYDESISDSTEILITSMKNAIAMVKLLVNTSFTIYNEEY